MAQLIDGKLISQQIKDELKEEVAQFKAEGIDICLAVIQVGSDPASSVYVRNKKKACAYIGVESRSYELPEETSEEELIKLVEELTEFLYSFRYRIILMKIRSSVRFHRIRM